MPAAAPLTLGSTMTPTQSAHPMPTPPPKTRHYRAGIREMCRAKPRVGSCRPAERIQPKGEREVTIDIAAHAHACVSAIAPRTSRRATSSIARLQTSLPQKRSGSERPATASTLWLIVTGNNNEASPHKQPNEQTPSSPIQVPVFKAVDLDSQEMAQASGLLLQDLAVVAVFPPLPAAAFPVQALVLCHRRRSARQRPPATR